MLEKKNSSSFRSCYLTSYLDREASVWVKEIPKRCEQQYTHPYCNLGFFNSGRLIDYANLGKKCTIELEKKVWKGSEDAAFWSSGVPSDFPEESILFSSFDFFIPDRNLGLKVFIKRSCHDKSALKGFTLADFFTRQDAAVHSGPMMKAGWSWGRTQARWTRSTASLSSPIVLTNLPFLKGAVHELCSTTFTAVLLYCMSTPPTPTLTPVSYRKSSLHVEHLKKSSESCYSRLGSEGTSAFQNQIHHIADVLSSQNTQKCSKCKWSCGIREVWEIIWRFLQETSCTSF